MPQSLSPHLPLESVSLSDLESLVPELDPNALPSIDSFLQRGATENAWVCFEADVRSAAATALERLRGHGGERCSELLRLCEFEEQTRCQAFQATIMGEVGPAVYQATVRSIIEKLLGKMETWAPEPSLYQAAAQCLSEYMSALNHHCDICAVPRASQGLPAIAEGPSRDESGMDSSEYPSELGSEDADTLSVHSETESAARRLSSDQSSHVALGNFGIAYQNSGGSFAMGAIDSEETRKEKRRESNKKASVKYRQKRTSSTKQIVDENASLRQQVTALSTQNSVLSAENQLLKQQVAFLQGMLQGGPAPAAAPPSVSGRSALTATTLPSPSPGVPTAPPPSFGIGAAVAAAAASRAGAPPMPLAMDTSSAASSSFGAAGGSAAPQRHQQAIGAAECGSECGVSEWLTADARLQF